jgi:uncharacterized protein (DUF736 family)
MAYGKTKPTSAPVPEEKASNRPDYTLRARQGPGSEFFQTIGAAWKKTDKNGKTFFSIRLNSQPVNWNGSCIMVEALPERE